MNYFEWYNKLLIYVDVDLPLNTVAGLLISFSFSISSLHEEGGREGGEKREDKEEMLLELLKNMNLISVVMF